MKSPKPALAALAALALTACGASDGATGEPRTRTSRSAASTASPSACSGGGGGGPNGGPADMFPCDSYWYKDVSALPAYGDPSLVSSIGAWGASGRFRIDFSIVFMHSDGTNAQHVALDPGYDPDNDHVDVPIPAGGALEGEAGYQCSGGGDCHLLVVDDSTNRLFELWQASQAADGTWSASEETVWDLTKTCGAGRGQGCTSADAAGFPILPGLIGVKETAAGEINHAIRFILPNNRIQKNGYVAPATHSTGAYSGQLPMGARLRLRASFDESQLPSAGAKTIARALKKYGMLLADAGEIALTAESDALESVKWDGLLGADDLVGIQPSDFDIVDFPGVPAAQSMDCQR